MQAEWPWRKGPCWLYCLRPNATVTRIGTVTSGSLHAGLYACYGCLLMLRDMVRDPTTHHSGHSRVTAPPTTSWENA